MRRIRYRIAYLLRLVAYKIEPRPSLLDLHLATLWRGHGKGDD